MFGLGVGELAVIFLIVFLLFGAKALPEVARSLGEAFRVFKKETQQITDSTNTDKDPKDPQDSDKPKAS